MKWLRFFIISAGTVLLTAALIRFAIAIGNEPVMLLPEPVLGIPIRYAVLLVGAFELAVAFVCLFGKNPGVQVGWVAWLATNDLVYRIGLFTMHSHPQATCIGSLTDPLRLAQGATGLITSLLPVYLLLGSYAGEVLLWDLNRKKEIAQHLKMSCPACGVHIRFDDRNLGQKISCPQCQNNITLRKPDLLKMACFFCQEHIEFPSHAIGEKMHCPHCEMDITLKEPA